LQKNLFHAKINHKINNSLGRGENPHR